MSPPTASASPAWPASPPTAAERDAFAGATARPFWLDRRVDIRTFPALSESPEADLCIVGGGFSGLWAALHAKRRDPERRVVLLEADAIGSGASGRNGGFLSSSITHGLENGLTRFAEEMRDLERLGMENFDGLKDDLDRYGIECDYEAAGELHVAVQDHQLGPLLEEAELLSDYGHEVEVLDGESLRAEVASPTYLGGVWDRTGAALVDPGKLSDGLARAIADLGVEVYERTPVDSLRVEGGRVRLSTPSASVSAGRVILGTNAFRPLVRSLRRYIVPVYDYVLVTEPLSDARLEAVGWRSRQGISDCGNQFHYYRLTDDNRILWGGFEAVYRYGGPVDARFDSDDETFACARAELLRHVPAAPWPALHPQVGRSDRHLQPVLVLLRPLPWRQGGLRRRLHRARRRLLPVRCAGRARPRSTASRARRRGWGTCGASRCRSRPSRCAGRSSSSPGGSSLPPIATAVATASGCGPSTASGSASTAERRRARAAGLADRGSETGHDQDQADDP